MTKEEGRNPFVNQVVCFIDKAELWEGDFKSRNPFVNQVVCFVGLNEQQELVYQYGMSQSLRESGRLFQVR